MARSKSQAPQTPPAPSRMLLPRAEIKSKLEERISLGREIHTADIRRESDLEELRAKRTKWNSYNVELLKRCFVPHTIADEYDRVSIHGALFANAPIGQLVDSFRSGMQKKITNLESIVEKKAKRVTP